MNTLPCIICRKELEPCTEDQTHIQPYDGIVCHSKGNYGSRAYDSFVTFGTWSSELIFCICDECLIKLSKDHVIAEADGSSDTPHLYEMELSTELWIHSEGFDDFQVKLKEAGLDNPE